MQINSLPTTFGATNMVVATGPCSLVAVRGFFKGITADRWLQIFDLTALPANATVPMRSFQLLQNLDFYKDFNQGPLQLKTGCVIAISTTEATLTIATIVTDLADFSVDLESTGQELPAGTSVAGDLITGVNSLQVWTNAQGPKKLIRVNFTNNDGVARYLMLFANDDWTDDQRPILQWKVLANTAVELNFGDDVLEPMSQIADGTIRRGCYLGISVTPGTMTNVSSSASYLKATYK